MNVKRCDRCGKIYGEFDGYRLAVAKEETLLYNPKEYVIDADLCKGCLELLENWYKHEPGYKE